MRGARCPGRTIFHGLGRPQIADALVFGKHWLEPVEEAGNGRRVLRENMTGDTRAIEAPYDELVGNQRVGTRLQHQSGKSIEPMGAVAGSLFSSIPRKPMLDRHLPVALEVGRDFADAHQGFYDDAVDCRLDRLHFRSELPSIALGGHENEASPIDERQPRQIVLGTRLVRRGILRGSFLECAIETIGPAMVAATQERAFSGTRVEDGKLLVPARVAEGKDLA